MPKAAIALEDWKLPVFRRRLENARFKYQDAGELTPGTTVLTVVTNDLIGLADVVKAAHMECAKAGPPKNGQ